MIFAQTVGTVVSTARSDEIEGAKFLLVRECSYKGELSDNYMIALDAVQTGPGEMVLIAQGSSCRQTENTFQKPVDALIVGIVDSIDEGGDLVFRK
jgi:ethanolamine utilization protein EutN